MNNLQEAYLAIYQEALDPEERALRRAEIADRKAGRMDSKVAKKYSDSESKSAEREDKKSKGKHIHGMADSVELDGDLVDEEIRNPESRKKLRAIMDTDKGRKGDASKGENPRSKYPSERSKQALHLLHGSGETGSKGNPVRSRGGTSAPPEQRDRSAANRKYWAGNAGPTRDRGAGNKAKRRSAELGEEKNDSYLETDMKKRQKNNEKAIDDMKKTKAHADMAKAARKHFEETDLEEKKGLWDNIHAKRKRGESPAKPGEKGYPKTLNVEELDQIIEGIRQARKNVGASKCWTGKKLGSPSTKMKGGKEVPNCVDEAVYGGGKKEPEDKRMVVTKADKTGNTKAYQNYKAGHKGYKAADHLGERALDPTEKAEKERLVTGMKKSAAGFKERYGKRAKEVMYATATKQAKERMDTSKSDRRYGVER